MDAHSARGWVTATYLLALLAGAPVGIGLYTFVYAHGTSYMTNDPRACANCHVMTEQFDGWVKSSHRSVAVCNDCHTPHTLFRKYLTKATNGFRHSFAFTTGWFAEPIRISETDRAITEETCRECHASIVEAIDANHAPGMELSCISCHRSEGHLH